MAEIIFYEKPGCITNGKQKKLLKQSGITFEAVSLLDYPWNEQELLAFFKGEPVTNWINPNAPDVKSGEVDVTTLTEQDALAMMIANPIFIRRPLIACKNAKWAGFDLQRISSALGISGEFKQDAAIENCSHPSEGECAQ